MPLAKFDYGFLNAFCRRILTVNWVLLVRKACRFYAKAKRWLMNLRKCIELICLPEQFNTFFGLYILFNPLSLICHTVLLKLRNNGTRTKPSCYLEQHHACIT